MIPDVSPMGKIGSTQVMWFLVKGRLWQRQHNLSLRGNHLQKQE